MLTGHVPLHPDHHPILHAAKEPLPPFPPARSPPVLSHYRPQSQPGAGTVSLFGLITPAVGTPVNTEFRVDWHMAPDGNTPEGMVQVSDTTAIVRGDGRASYQFEGVVPPPCVNGWGWVVKVYDSGGVFLVKTDPPEYLAK